MKEKFKQLELFLKSSNFDRGIRLGVGITAPFALLYFTGYFEYAPAVVVGTFLNAPGDIPGSMKRKVNAILVSIGLTMVITVCLVLKYGYRLKLILR